VGKKNDDVDGMRLPLLPGEEEDHTKLSGEKVVGSVLHIEVWYAICLGILHVTSMCV